MMNAVEATERGAPVLEAVDLETGYGPVAVVRDLNLHVNAGEIVALLGSNGAGKTTTLLALSGELPLTKGEVRIDGQPSRQPLHKRARAGLGFVTEERSVFKGLSTADNLRVGRGDRDAALRLFPELAARANVRGGLLSGGEQQMLTLARALSRRPRILLADELSLGLAPLVVERLLQAVQTAAWEQGTAVLLVEQHVRKALRYADRAYVMRRGRIEIAGSAASIAEQIEEIEAKYLSLHVSDSGD
jgi:branched-chain amino acid transport system ATP-binding protein